MSDRPFQPQSCQSIIATQLSLPANCGRSSEFQYNRFMLFNLPPSDSYRNRSTFAGAISIIFSPVRGSLLRSSRISQAQSSENFLFYFNHQ
ncbi:MAG: hypothetical protein ACXWTS_00610, partial [Methylococcaceae bacterium]